MAKRIVDEEMRFTVVVNGNEAQKELFDLEKATRDLTQTNKNLKAQKDKLKASGKQESAEYKKITASIKENNLALKSNKTRMKVLQDQIGLTGLTMRQLSQRSSQLKLQLHNMVPGSAQYLKLQADLKAVDARMFKLKMSSRAAEGSISRLATGFNKYFAIGASFIAAGTGMVLSVQKMIDYNGKLSDSQSDVMKTTGLTKIEVDELTKSFGMFKTRTARIELLKLSEEAGRLGITGVKNLQDYVAVANQMKVALGDDLSDEAIRDVGKMTKIYEVGTQTGKEFAAANMALGSAINEVSASGANTSDYLVNYLKRQAGIAVQAKISADQNLGYAATFDEIGQSVEISATAMNKVWLDMFDNSGDYAKIAGLSIKDFNNLLQTDSNEAMILFLEGLNGNNEGLSVMVDKLGDLEVGGARGIQAISALAGSTDLLRKRQELASLAISEATSLTEEYNIKNNNLAAILEKIQKRMIGAFASETVIKNLESIVTWFAKFIGATEDASGEVVIWKERLVAALKVLMVVIAAILSYQAAIKLASLWTARSSAITKIHYALLLTEAIATKSLALAKALLTGNIQKVIVAYRALTLTMALNPIGLMVALVGAAVTAYYAFSDSAEKAATAQSIMNKASTEAVKTTRAEVNEMNGLIAVAKDDKISKEQRVKAIVRLNEISPEYLGNLSLENINTIAATKSLDDYVDSLVRAAKAKAIKAQLDAKAEELATAEGSSLEDNIKWYEQLWNQISNLNDTYSAAEDNMRSAINNKKEYIDVTKDELKIIEDQYKAQLKINAQEDGKKVPKTGPKEGDKQLIDGELYVFSGGRWKKQVIKPKDGDPGKKKDEFKVDPTKEQNELRKIQEENDRLKASLISDSFKREVALQEANHQVTLGNIREQLIEIAELENLDQEILKARSAGDTKKVDALTATKKIWIQKNAELNKQLEYEEFIHQNKLGTILQQGIQDQAQQDQEKFDRETVLRQTAHNLELAALGSNGKARKALQENFDREEEERQRIHLEKLISDIKSILADVDFQGMDLELIPPEKRQELLDFLAAANLQLSDLLNKSASGKGVEGSSLAGGVDILGFSVDQWTSTFENLDTAEQKIAAAEMAIGAMMNAWGMYSDFVAAKQQVELAQFERGQEKKSGVLDRQLDRGYLTQRQYNKAVEELEKETNRKRAEMEYKQAKRQKAMAIANILMNTALGIAKTLGETGFFGIPLAAIVGAMGAVQLGIAVATPLPAKGFEDGLYPVRREQDGQMFNAGYGGEVKSGLVKKPTLFMAGEKNKPEMIIDNKAWMKMDPDVKNSLYRELSRVKGFESGYYPPQPQQSIESAAGNNSQGNDYSLFAAALNRNSAVMERLERTGLTAVMSGSLENAKQIQDKINDYNKLRNANKR